MVTWKKIGKIFTGGIALLLVGFIGLVFSDSDSSAGSYIIGVGLMLLCAIVFVLIVSKIFTFETARFPLLKKIVKPYTWGFMLISLWFLDRFYAYLIFEKMKVSEETYRVIQFGDTVVWFLIFAFFIFKMFGLNHFSRGTRARSPTEILNSNNENYEKIVTKKYTFFHILKIVYVFALIPLIFPGIMGLGFGLYKCEDNLLSFCFLSIFLAYLLIVAVPIVGILNIKKVLQGETSKKSHFLALLPTPFIAFYIGGMIVKYFF